MMMGGQEVLKRLLWGCIVALLLAYAAEANTLAKLRVVDSNHSAKIILSASEPPLHKIAPDLEQNLLVIHLDGISVIPDFSMPRITSPLIQDIKISSSSSTAPAGETADGLKVEILFKTSDVSFRHEALDKPASLLFLIRQGKSSTKTEELVPSLLLLGGVQKVLQNLLREWVSIRDLLTILEALADCAPLNKDLESLTEYARQRLGHSICKAFQNDQGILGVMVLEPSVETVLIDAAKRREPGGPLALDPQTAQRLLERMAATREQVLASGGQVVLLCSPTIRAPLRRFLERFLPQLAVLSHHDIAPDIQVQSTATVGFSDAIATV